MQLLWEGAVQLLRSVRKHRDSYVLHVRVGSLDCHCAQQLTAVHVVMRPLRWHALLEHGTCSAHSLCPGPSQIPTKTGDVCEHTSNRWIQATRQHI
jgi:hypothetical protein